MPNNDTNSNLDSKQSLEYVYETLIKLGKIAKGAGESSLVYYLEMATLEALEISNDKTVQREANITKLRGAQSRQSEVGARSK